jgi:hypothetical protein
MEREREKEKEWEEGREGGREGGREEGREGGRRDQQLRGHLLREPQEQRRPMSFLKVTRGLGLDWV